MSANRRGYRKVPKWEVNHVYDYHNANAFIKYGIRESFAAFCLAMYPGYKITSHIKLLIDKLERIEAGKIKKLIVCMPPRHGKSQTISKLFPCWFLGRNPNKRVIFSTYSQEFAEEFGRDVRNRMEEEIYPLIFPESKISKDSSSVKKFAIQGGGLYSAVGVGGALTGKGGDLIIVDDPHKNRQEASSETYQKRIVDWFRSTLYTRLSPEGRIILIQTRWHEADLAGYILDHYDDWDTLIMPAINEEGEALWPEEWSIEKLLEVKKTIGSYEFSAQYQQSPVPDSGSIIKREWIKTYTELPIVKSYSWSFDTAIKTGQENDYSVGQLWAECENGFYLVEMFRAKLEYPELRKTVQALYNKHKAHEVLVEDKASGQQIVQDFKRIGNMPIIPMIPGKEMPSTKNDRMQLVSPLFEAGKVFIPEKVEWLIDFIQEIVSFPNAKHDDICDATTQYLIRKLNCRQKAPNIRIL